MLSLAADRADGCPPCFDLRDPHRCEMPVPNPRCRSETLDAGTTHDGIYLTEKSEVFKREVFCAF
jgi:hypothetical protein